MADKQEEWASVEWSNLFVALSKLKIAPDLKSVKGDTRKGIRQPIGNKRALVDAAKAEVEQCINALTSSPQNNHIRRPPRLDPVLSSFESQHAVREMIKAGEAVREPGGNHKANRCVLFEAVKALIQVWSLTHPFCNREYDDDRDYGRGNRADNAGVTDPPVTNAGPSDRISQPTRQHIDDDEDMVEAEEIDDDYDDDASDDLDQEAGEGQSEEDDEDDEE
ncbi:hypothetical protein F5Y08DRAFT_49142 [Xylaria arbuscula]|nr:hypothetical protein F5Y08DRAFT_49142 [Xylaria arbuscula]